MELIHDKPKKPKIKLRQYECPACREQVTINPNKLISFPRTTYHPFTSYRFFRGYIFNCCGYLPSKIQVDNMYSRLITK